MTLTSIFKSILLIIFSVIVWNTHISSLQATGYCIALAGLVYYSFGYEKLVAGSEFCVALMTSLWKKPFAGEGRLWSRIGKVALLITTCLLCIYMSLWGLHEYGVLEKNYTVF